MLKQELCKVVERTEQGFEFKSGNRYIQANDRLNRVEIFNFN